MTTTMFHMITRDGAVWADADGRTSFTIEEANAISDQDSTLAIMPAFTSGR